MSYIETTRWVMLCNILVMIRCSFLKTILVISLFFLQINVAISDYYGKSNFKIYDAMIYRGKPDMQGLGIEPLTLLNHVHLLDKNKDKIKNKISGYYLSNEIEEVVVINIENWSLATDEDRRVNIPRYTNIVKYVKNLYPDKMIGIYSMYPERNYWASQKDKSSKEYKRWQDNNNALKNISKYADIIMPSIYTYFPDRKGWLKYAKAQIEEARRNYPTKLVYPFLWPQYHMSSLLYGGRYIEGDFWRLQLEAVYQYADGVIIWGGWDDKSQQHSKWIDGLDWWDETKSFASRIKAN